MLGPLRVLTPLTLAALALNSNPPPTAFVDDDFASRVAPLLASYCIECHESEDPAGELDLTHFRSQTDALAAPHVWQAVEFMLSSGEMPPQAASRHPEPSELEPIREWIAAHIEVAPATPIQDSAGRTTARRLNRYEFQNAILDLFGVDFAATELLPADGVGHGFDVLGDVLSMPPLLFEKTFEAVESIVAEAIPLEAQYREELRVAAQLKLEGAANLRNGKDVVSMHSVGTAIATFEVPRRGEYIVRLRAAAQQAGPDPARAAVSIDGREVQVIDVTATTESAEDYEVRVPLDAGRRRVSARFINDYYMPDDPDPKQRDRNLYVVQIGLLGPTDVPLQTPFEAQFVRGDELQSGTAGLRKIVERVARLAWRTDVSRTQVTELLQLAPKQSSSREQLRTALTAILISPRFLYRLEPDARSGARELDGFELATRLAACLWSSVPDDRLLDAAADGDLADPSRLAAEVDRLLNDARSSRLSVAFAGQWLQLRRLEDASPDPQRFPEWSDALRDSMRRESEAFFEAVLRERRPITELLSADFTFVDERLARHYGIKGVHGDALQRIAIPAQWRGKRGGILGQAGPLVATSMPNRTSPVVRGKWVLEALLATPPPPPPPGVDSIDASTQDGKAASVREQLELHRKKRACAVCHEPMDGLGFALENYGPTGAWRESEGGLPIDTRAKLPGGVRFEGPDGLREILLRDDKFVRGLAQQFAIYATGRALTPVDVLAVDRIVAALPTAATLNQLIRAVVTDDLFRHHPQAEPE